MKKNFYENHVCGHNFAEIGSGRRSFKCSACGLHGINYHELRRNDGRVFFVGKRCSEKILFARSNLIDANNDISFTSGNSRRKSLIYPEKDWKSTELRHGYARTLIEIMIVEVSGGSLSSSGIMDFFESYFFRSGLDFEMWETNVSEYTFIEFILYLARSDFFSTSDMRVFFEDCLKFMRIVDFDYEEWKLDRRCFV